MLRYGALGERFGSVSLAVEIQMAVDGGLFECLLTRAFFAQNGP